MSAQDPKQTEWSEWTKIIKKYTQPSAAKSWWQIINSFVPYFALWVAMVYSLQFSYWLTLGLALIAAGFLVRIFIIFHDCGHGSFFKSQRMNSIVGIPAGALVFTPYHKWNHEHHIHHQTVGNLDKRGHGDVLTWTVEEFGKGSKGQRFFYRTYRNPIVLFLIAPLFSVHPGLSFSGQRPHKKNEFVHPPHKPWFGGFGYPGFLF